MKRQRPSPTNDDRELAALLIQFRGSGDLAVLGQIVERTYRDIFGLALRLLHNHASAEDLTQDVYRLLGQKCNAIKDPCRLRAWLRKVTLNQARRYRPRWDLRSFEDLEELYAEVATAPSVYDLVADADNRKVFAQALRKAVDKLKPKLRTCLELIVFQRLDPANAAQIMGVSVETVYSYRSQGIAALRACKELREYL